MVESFIEFQNWFLSKKLRVSDTKIRIYLEHLVWFIFFYKLYDIQLNESSEYSILFKLHKYENLTAFLQYFYKQFEIKIYEAT